MVTLIYLQIKRNQNISFRQVYFNMKQQLTKIIFAIENGQKLTEFKISHKKKLIQSKQLFYHLQQLNFIKFDKKLLRSFIRITKQMQKMKQDYQTNIFGHINPYMQHQQELQSIKSNFDKSLPHLKNSFISTKNVIETEKQNIIFSDHNQIIPKDSFSSNQQKDLELQHNHQQNQILQNNYVPESQSFYYYQKDINIIEQASLENEISQQNNQQFQYSHNQQSISDREIQCSMSFSQKPSLTSIDESYSELQNKKYHKFKNSIENLDLNHKDQMLLGSKVISGLEKNIVSLPFRQPVDIIALNIPDYPQIIKQPMDLRTIKKKLSDDFYTSIYQIYSDIQLIISNSFKYNELNPDFIRLTKNFEKSYHKIRRDCQRNMRKIKIQQDKKVNFIPKRYNPVKKQVDNSQNKSSLAQQDIASGFKFTQLAKLAKKIRKLLPQQQIDLFQKIGIINTLTIDIKVLNSKQVRCLIKEVERNFKIKQQMIRNEQKKQSSYITTCEDPIRKDA